MSIRSATYTSKVRQKATASCGFATRAKSDASQSTVLQRTGPVCQQHHLASQKSFLKQASCKIKAIPLENFTALLDTHSEINHLFSFCIPAIFWSLQQLACFIIAGVLKGKPRERDEVSKAGQWLSVEMIQYCSTLSRFLRIIGSRAFCWVQWGKCIENEECFFFLKNPIYLQIYRLSRWKESAYLK